MRNSMTSLGNPGATIIPHIRGFAISSATLLVLILFVNPALQAQQFSVIHSFTSMQGDGAGPVAGVTIGNGGVLYGTTEYGGTSDEGAVYELVHQGSSWAVYPLYDFLNWREYEFNGSEPIAGVVVGSDGKVYGTTYYGEEGFCNGPGCGTVFELTPLSMVCRTCYWSQRLLRNFAGSPDGSHPAYGSLIFDAAGNLYGTASGGGANGVGAVFELTESDGGWMENIIYSFSNNGSDGTNPLSGLIFDTAGNLYGTTGSGGSRGIGTVFKLTPSGGGWTESILYDFTVGTSGSGPIGTLIEDPSGNLYGTTYGGGSLGEGGTVFELTPSNGGWNYSLVHSFSSCSPVSGVTMDAAGNLYGVCEVGGTYGDGTAYELTPSGGTWTLTDLHDFTGGSDGGNPEGLVTFAEGNLYGTAFAGGTLSDCSGSGCGTVWEISGLSGAR